MDWQELNFSDFYQNSDLMSGQSLTVQFRFRGC